MRIQHQQMGVFADREIAHFTRRALRHIQVHYAQHHRLVGEAPLRRAIGHALSRAEHHGIFSERGTSLMLDVMLFLGSHFEHDAALPWAAALLGDAALGDPEARLDVLVDEALDHFDRLAGPNQRLLDMAVVRLRRWLAQGAQGAWGEAGAGGEALLQRLFPSKCEALGAQGVATTLACGEALARRCGLGLPQGGRLCAVLALYFGCGLDRDPLLPWLAPIVEGGAGTAADKTERLRAAALAFVTRWLEGDAPRPPDAREGRS